MRIMSHHRRRAIVILGAIIIMLPAAIFAQGKPSRSAGKPTQSAGKPTQSAGKPTKESSCDGALEIVPSQPVTFARKRRPAKDTPTSTETQAEKKQAGETQN